MPKISCLASLMLIALCVRLTSVSAFNPITFIKNWSLKGSSSFPMPKNFLEVQRLIMREGFSHETYHVTTEDGYILQLTRILPLKESTTRRIPVLLIHGVLATADAWVSRGRSQDLAFILTESGYDVWLGDLRGNSYGKHHKFLSPHNPRFWDYSFHEHGMYDLPALVDFILMKSGEPKLGYVGHSMGTTVFLTFTSVRPEYNKKIFAAVLLAPVGAKFPFEEIHNSAMRLLLTQFSVVYDTLKSAGLVEILPRTPRLVSFVRKYCSHPPEQDYCLDFIGQFYGEHRANLDRKTFGEQLAYLPAGSSLRTFDHLSQIYKNGFYMYDYGPKLNMIKYNSTTPLLYPLNLITAPIFLYYGENDPLTSAQGTNFLANAIPGVQWAKAVPNHKYTHTDFMYGLDTNTTVYSEIFRFFDRQLRQSTYR